ncbi:UNVERIFIED_CONTAM: hypothetical protein NCL1_12851 [Trichonephila clavipes]
MKTNVKYMFGEEGYALSSFLTALKYIEIRKRFPIFSLRNSPIVKCRNQIIDEQNGDDQN